MFELNRPAAEKPYRVADRSNKMRQEGIAMSKTGEARADRVVLYRIEGRRSSRIARFLEELVMPLPFSPSLQKQPSPANAR